MTLRPNAPGDLTQWSVQFPVPGAHWDKVAEAVADEDATYVEAGQPEGFTHDLYNLPASGGAGVIAGIEVFVRHYSTGAAAYPACRIRTGGNDFSNILARNGAYDTDGSTWANNPDTVAAWTWADIDALQIGVTNQNRGGGLVIHVTQVYVEIDYTPVGWSGKISGVTDPAEIQGVAKADIAEVKGVA